MLGEGVQNIEVLQGSGGVPRSDCGATTQPLLQDLEFARVPTGMTLTSGKYVLVENSMKLSAQGYDGKSNITGTRRTEITDNRSSTTDPNFLATVSFTWQGRTKLSGSSTPTTHTISATSRIYPLQVDGEETYYTP